MSLDKLKELDTKQVISVILAVVGILTGLAGGSVLIIPATQQKCEVDLSAAQVRVEMLTEVKNSCKTALETCK